MIRILVNAFAFQVRADATADTILRRFRDHVHGAADTRGWRLATCSPWPKRFEGGQRPELYHGAAFLAERVGDESLAARQWAKTYWPPPARIRIIEQDRLAAGRK